LEAKTRQEAETLEPKKRRVERWKKVNDGDEKEEPNEGAEVLGERDEKKDELRRRRSDEEEKPRKKEEETEAEEY
jgi:hypothetical protein